MLTIFYDGQCPMCEMEIKHLKIHDTNNLIHAVDIHQHNFKHLYPKIDFIEAMKILHGTYEGELLLGLEVTYRAWTLVGKGSWVAPLNWPGIKTITHWIYLIIAKHRHKISPLLAILLGIEVNHCKSGTCYDKSTNLNRRR
jgi:predicted DCC family thiol-disulfide oxidoreductase YuxK